MTTTNIVEKVAEKANLTKKDAKEMTTAVIETVIDALADGEEVRISGLGTFKIKVVPERTGTVMMGDRKGEKYVTPEHKAVKFSVAKGLKEAVAAL